MPTALYPASFAATKVVPDPANGSKIVRMVQQFLQYPALRVLTNRYIIKYVDSNSASGYYG